jgi:hypothetical protein
LEMFKAMRAMLQPKQPPRIRACHQCRVFDDLVPAGAFVLAYSGLADREQTLIWLEQAYKEQSLIMLFLRVHPVFDPVRDDPRFKDLLRRVGLD